MEPLPPQAHIDRAASDAQRRELAPGQHLVLELGQPGDRSVHPARLELPPGGLLHTRPMLSAYIDDNFGLAGHRAMVPPHV
ncbi:MAG TPA: hypothetical protein VEY90_09865 [Thermoleophilaceae bacterium]|jgi:hypothetical protein|nr:hypothetical protein [Thermoleophilaceae bacterium]